MLFVKLQSNLLGQKLIQWLDQVTNNKLFEYCHKILNKEQPEQNLLWFSSSSFHSLDEWLANQIEKTITKHYFKKDLLPNYKLKEFTDYISNKHPSEAKLLKLTIEQARKLTKQDVQNYCSVIKNFQNAYYEDLRINFIQSLEILENDKCTKKRKKNKRKGKKKTSCSPPAVNSHNQNYVSSPHKRQHYHSQNEKDSDQQQLNVQLVPQIAEQILKGEQSTGQFQIEEQNKQQNKSDQANNKKCICKDETNSHITHQKKPKQKNSNSKNLVINRQRSRSPYTKSNTIDNQCSNSMFSGEIFETFTQAITEQCTTKAQEFQNFQEQMNQGSQSFQQNIQNKKKRKRKNNNTNRYIEEMIKKGSSGLINKQLTNFIDNLSIQTNNLYESKVICFQRVRYFIKILSPQTQAQLFGSNSMGLSLPSSDVDIMLYNVPCRSRQQIKQMLAQIAIEINAMGWIVSCSTYLNAKVPIVKLQIDPLISYFQTKRRCDYQNVYDPNILYYLDVKDRKKAKNIHVDLTIFLQDQGPACSPSTELMKTWLNQNITLQRTILVFKYILAEKGYNKNFSGGLGSYCLFIMIAAYFKEFKQTLPEDEGQIFLDILKFYSEEFQNKLKLITLKEQGNCFISLQESFSIGNLSEVILSNPLRIIDPISLNLTSSSCAQYHGIKSQFRRIRSEILSQLQKLQKQVSSNYSPIQLGKVLASQKSIQKWIHKYESKTRFSIKKIIDGSTQNR